MRRITGLFRGAPKGEKHRSELAYWRERRRQQGPLEEGAPLYRWFFCDFFELSDADFAGRRILDIGCGPRGSLEWADMAAERVGLDPLAEEYVRLHESPQQMQYVAGGAEEIPFDDGHFDYVSTFNSLDHTDDVDAAIAEITRVTRRGGSLLLLCDVGHEPTPTEPQAFGWEITDRFAGDWNVAWRRDYERPTDNMYENLRQHDRPFDHGNPQHRPGVLAAHLHRR